MLTYRGDKFVRGKTYKLDESLTFIKREEDNLVFESVDNKTITMTEAEFESKLLEKINQENKDINEIIGKVLRSKGLARKYEDLLKSKGISIDYSSPQGVTLTGPNGRVLGASSKEVYGPHTPDSSGDRYDKDGYRRDADGHYQTDEKPDDYYAKYRDEEKANLEKLEKMERDDIIRTYPDKTSEEALKAHQELIDRTKKRIEDYTKSAESADKRYRRSLSGAKAQRRNAQYDRLRSATSKEKADETMDYLNYLTKPKNDYMDTIRNTYKGSYDHRSKSNPGGPYENSDKESDLDKYKNLKGAVQNAQHDIDVRTSSSNGYHYSNAAMTDEELEAKIKSMRDELEQKIKELRKSNKSNTKERDRYVKELEKKEKDLDNFLKSKGIRESELLEANLMASKSEKNSRYSEEFYKECRKQFKSDNFQAFLHELETLYDTDELNDDTAEALIKKYNIKWLYYKCSDCNHYDKMRLGELERLFGEGLADGLAELYYDSFGVLCWTCAQEEK